MNSGTSLGAIASAYGDSDTEMEENGSPSGEEPPPETFETALVAKVKQDVKSQISAVPETPKIIVQSPPNSPKKLETIKNPDTVSGNKKNPFPTDYRRREVISSSSSEEDSTDSSSSSSSDEDSSLECASKESSDSECSDKEKVLKKKKGTRQRYKENSKESKGELDDLPPIEELTISVPEVLCDPLGEVAWTVEQLVVVRPQNGKPTLNLDTVLFVERGRRALGRIFDVFGQVSEPYYCVRFNSAEHIEESDIKIGMPVYFCPNSPHTSLVFLHELTKIKASDTVDDDNEPPEFSNDEDEIAYYATLKEKQNGDNKTVENSRKKRRVTGRKTTGWQSNHPWNNSSRIENSYPNLQSNFSNQMENSWRHQYPPYRHQENLGNYQFPRESIQPPRYFNPHYTHRFPTNPYHNHPRNTFGRFPSVPWRPVMPPNHMLWSPQNLPVPPPPPQSSPPQLPAPSSSSDFLSDPK